MNDPQTNSTRITLAQANILKIVNTRRGFLYEAAVEHFNSLESSFELHILENRKKIDYCSLHYSRSTDLGRWEVID